MRNLFLAILVLLLGACSQLGLAPATNLQQQLAYDYSAVASVRQSAAQALQAGTITPAVAQTILQDTDKARQTLDAAEAIVTSNSTADLSNVQNDLQIVSQILTQVQAMLPKQTPLSAAPLK
jgi:hypothetical protein